MECMDKDLQKDAAVRRSLVEANIGSSKEAVEAHNRSLLLDRPWKREESNKADLSPDDLIKMYSDMFPRELNNG